MIIFSPPPLPTIQKSLFYATPSSFKHTVHFAFVLALFYRLTFVIFFLTFGKSYDNLCQPLVADKHLQRHNRKPAVFRSLAYFTNFLLVQQQLAVSPRRMIVVGSIDILPHIHILYPNLAIVLITERICQARLAKTN